MQQYDLAIIGGGPAGVAAGVYAARKRLNTIFITKDWNGQSSVSEGVENWIGEVKISGLDLSKKLENHLKAYAGDVLHIKEGEWCKEVKMQKTKGKSEEGSTPPLREGNLSRRVSEEGGEKVYRSEKAAVLCFNFNYNA